MAAHRTAALEGESVTQETEKTDDRFFNRIKRVEELRETLERCGFDDIKPYERVVNQRESLRFEKSGWRLPPARGQEDTIRLYFESVRLGDLRLRVDLEPHRLRSGELDIAGRAEQRQRAVERRRKLLERIRVQLLNFREMPEGTRVSSRSLRRPDRPSTMTAAKFDLPLRVDSSPEEVAAAFAGVIARVSPLIDRVIANGARTGRASSG